MSWQVVRCMFGRVSNVSTELFKLPFVDDVYSPVHEIETVYNGAKRIRKVPYLGSLALVDWEGDDPALWHRIRSVAGVLSILGIWPDLMVVSSYEVEKFRRRVRDIEAMVVVDEIEPPCKSGELIQFTYLAFWRVRAHCLWASNGVVGVRLRLLGQDHLLQVPYEFVDGVIHEDVRAPQYGRKRGRSGQ